MSLKIHDARGPGFYTYKQALSGQCRASEDGEIPAHWYQLKVIDIIMYSTLANVYLRNSMVTRAAGTYSTYICDSWRLKCAGNISGAKSQVPTNMAALGLCYGLGMYTSRGIQLDLWKTSETNSEAIGRISCLAGSTCIEMLDTTSKFRVQHCYLPIYDASIPVTCSHRTEPMR